MPIAIEKLPFSTFQFGEYGSTIAGNPVQDIFQGIVAVEFALELELSLFETIKIDENPGTAHRGFGGQLAHVIRTCNRLIGIIVGRMKHLNNVLMKVDQRLGRNVFFRQPGLLQRTYTQIQRGLIDIFDGQCLRTRLAIIHGNKQIFGTRSIGQRLTVSSRRLIDPSKFGVVGIGLQCLECFVQSIQCLRAALQSIGRS